MNDISKLPKWAQAERAEREKELRLARALVWPTMPEPKLADIRSALDGNGYQTVFIGWHLHTWNDGFRVEQGCSDGRSHNTGNIERTAFQECGSFYNTKAEALLKARWNLCRNFAAVLALLDEQMETAATAEPSRLGVKKKGY